MMNINLMQAVLALAGPMDFINKLNPWTKQVAAVQYPSALTDPITNFLGIGLTIIIAVAYMVALITSLQLSGHHTTQRSRSICYVGAASYFTVCGVLVAVAKMMTPANIPLDSLPTERALAVIAGGHVYGAVVLLVGLSITMMLASNVVDRQPKKPKQGNPMAAEESAH